MSLVEAAPIAAHSAAPTLPRLESSGEAEGGSQGWRSPNGGPHPSNAQQDYSVVMLVKTVGSLVGAPVMTFAWVKGIGLGGAALGLPYFLSAVSTDLDRLDDERVGRLMAECADTLLERGYSAMFSEIVMRC